MYALILPLIFAFATAAHAETPAPAAYEWQNVGGLTSASVAHSEWKLVSSNTVGWPDGSSALLTYWEKENPRVYLRCVDSKDSSFKDTGSICAKSGLKKK